MNPLVLHPLASPPNTLRVWLGATGRTAAPVVSWQLNGQQAQPIVRRALTSARPDSGANAMVTPDTPRVFSGIFEFNGVQAGAEHEIKASDDAGNVAVLSCTAMPGEIPAGLEDAFNVLLVSCFHAHEDKHGAAGALIARLPTRFRPHLTILMGDQVYLDLPTLKDFKPRVDWLSNKFENDYANNWCEPAGYAEILHAAPSVATPDDHEYWNDYPRVQPHLDTTWGPKGRTAWQAAAAAMYQAFQQNHVAAPNAAFELDVPPLTVFVMDTRTNRQGYMKQLVHPSVMVQFHAWIDRIIQNKLIGMVVSGQSFVEPAAGEDATDLTVADFKEFPDIVKEIGRALDNNRPMILATGDVHWGRVTEIVDLKTAQPRMFEVISSPTSLVSTIGKDQIASIGAAISGIFGKKKEWPRHSDSKPAPAYFAQSIFGKRFKTGVLHKQKGNMVALLSFRRAGLGVELRIRYWPIHGDKPVGAPNELARALLLLDT